MSLHYLENYTYKLIKADICIVGGGIAGLTIADSLRESGLEICLLEAGSKVFDIIKGLFDAKNIGNNMKVQPKEGLEFLAVPPQDGRAIITF